MNRILVIGATGLVGQEIVKALRTSSKATKIHVLVRHPFFSKLNDPKIQEFVMDFDRLNFGSECFKVDAVMCAIGTTIKKAGSQEAFRKVDYGYPLQIASICRNHGTSGFYLVSAMGANPRSKIFYNRVKGELELAIEKLGFESFVIARPSVLLGKRQESRPLEKLSQQIGRFFPKKWKSVPVERVARSLVNAFEESHKGKIILENADILSET